MQPKEPVLIGDWLADPRDDSLTRGNERVKLEPRTMRLLMRLAQAPGIVVSQDELLESVWTGLVVGPASVYQSMSQLRKMLGDVEEPARYIETVARKGYRLVATVSAAPVIAPTAIHAQAAAEPPAPLAAASVSDAPALPDETRSQQSFWTLLAGAAAVVVMAVAWRVAPPMDVVPDLPSIVVLPFTDMTPGKTEQVFCDGLTEEMSNWLAQVPTLRVVARTSAFAYRDTRKDVRTIGAELDTSHVLEGSLRRSGNRLRITVQLIHAPSQFHLWSHSYDVEAGDVIKVQEDVARQVVGNLEIRVTPETDSRLAGRRSSNSEAQTYYLLAKSHAQHLDPQSNERAIELFRQALKADPSFALAKVWLASSIANRRYFNNQPIEALMPEIQPLLDEVEKSSPQLVDLYVVRGGIRTELRQREAALADLEHALDLNPSSVDAASALGFYYLTMAQPRDAVAFYTISSGLDPRQYTYHVYRCIAHTHMAQFTTAEQSCARARSLKPESPWPYSTTGELSAARGDLANALKWSDEALAHGGDIAENRSTRAYWLLELGLIADAAGVYRSSMENDPGATRQNPALTIVGAAAAIDSGGARGFREFIETNGLTSANDPFVLFALANAAMIAGDGVLAGNFVDRATASDILQPEDIASPWQAIYGQAYLLVIAAAERARGNETEAARRLDELALLLARLDESGVQTSGFHELQAQLAAMRGDGDAAMAALRRAAQIGWRGVWLAEHQTYFESLRARPDYQELIASVRARNTEMASALRSRLLRAGLAAGIARWPALSRSATLDHVKRLEHHVDRPANLESPERDRSSPPLFGNLGRRTRPAEGGQVVRNDVLGRTGRARHGDHAGLLLAFEKQLAGRGGEVGNFRFQGHAGRWPLRYAFGEEPGAQARDECGVFEQCRLDPGSAFFRAGGIVGGHDPFRVGLLVV